jgi:hypothetical protein
VVANWIQNSVAVLLNHPEATHFQVSASAAVTAGAPFDLTVTALSGFNTVVKDYAGTVAFASSDVYAGLPAPYTFAAADQGVHTFAGGAVLYVAGAQSVTATDLANPSLTGSAALTVLPGAAYQLGLYGPDHVTADLPFDLLVVVYDAYYNVVTGYTGTVTFAGMNSGGGLPAAYTFTAADQGVHDFSGVFLHDPGAQTITAADTLDPTIAGALAVTVDGPGGRAHG